MKVTFAGTPVELQGNEIKVGQTAADFNAVKNDLGAFKLSDIKGRKLIVAVPSLDTSVCDAEVRRFNAAAAGFKGTTVITISMDLPFAQSRWCGAAGIDKVITVSDYKERDFAFKYGVYLPNVGLLARAIFVLDEHNKVTYVEYVPEVTAHPDYDKALAAVKG
jgi:thiol peroxidase